ncbi:hypothetical protein KBB96_12140 [Luteolibacter ambystomatis]|uniref:Uncharacterized protein n=1 Tax=Luteolibacter ambystomatis TaxID=2824561 RepID=A0A975IXW8_9BACT|nr:hypothetical protein [Luteolibacter ambystomatis]QUE49622.1 hypothetical protein KBB96_12140 [Luteolibacter ambystomatis]
MSRSSKLLLAASVCLLAVLAILLTSRQKSSGTSSVVLPRATTQREVKPAAGSDQGGQIKRPERGRVREDQQSSGSAQLDAILRDTTRDDAAVAVKLQDLAGRKDIPLEERIEALEHAVLLTPDGQGEGLVALARDPALPPELASILLSDFHNRPDPVRLAGAVALAKNKDASTRGEAMDLVRFLVTGNESEGNDVEILEKAEAKLQNPAQRE